MCRLPVQEVGMKDFVTCHFCARMIRLQDAVIYSRLFVKHYFCQGCIRVWKAENGVKVK